MFDSRLENNMNIYLVRHGDALTAAENPLRPLSVSGRLKVERLALAARQRGAEPKIIYHSGIVRAAETAEILARRLTSASHVSAATGLLPEDDPAIIMGEIERSRDAVMLVGHLPFMSRLAGLLLHHDPERPEFVPASMLCCTGSAAEWKISWQIAA